MTFEQHLTCVLKVAMDAKELVFRAQDAVSTMNFEQVNAEHRGMPKPTRPEIACTTKLERELRRARSALEAVDRAVMDARLRAGRGEPY